VAVVTAPALAPDGSWAVFAVRRHDVEGDATWSELWRVDVAGGGLRQLTRGRHDDGSPSVSPDGRRILFTSTRSGSSQLWSLPVAGGEAVQLSDFAPGLWDPVWSRDGTRLAALSEVWPDCGAQGDCHTARETAAGKGKLDVYVADDLLYRHWTSWKRGPTSHVLIVDAASGATTPSRPTASGSSSPATARASRPPAPTSTCGRLRWRAARRAT
jgi:dipeptidyl aminopeptidase/acylaminoacyl peptidase